MNIKPTAQDTARGQIPRSRTTIDLKDLFKIIFRYKKLDLQRKREWPKNKLH